ncbi:MAG: hypothetical protein WEC79_07175, partial [Thermomicrobiales bacterium]
MLVADMSSNRVWIQRDGAGRVGDLVRFIQVLEDSVEERQRALDLDLNVEQLSKREEQTRLKRREGNQITNRKSRRLAGVFGADDRSACQPVGHR